MSDDDFDETELELDVDELEAEDLDEDAIVFRRLSGKEDWLAVLKACPVSMDDVPPRRRETARRRKL